MFQSIRFATIRSPALSLLLALALAVVSILPLYATPAAQTDASATNPFLLLFPQLEQMAAPDWLKEGTRVTYASAFGTIGGENGGAGSGYIQYDVVAQDKKNVATTQSIFLDVNGNGILSSSPGLPAIEIAGSGQFWLNPEVLADAEQVANDNLSVTRMTEQDAAGKRYKVLRFQYEDDRSRTASAIDAESGLLIFFTQTILNRDGTRNESQLRLAGIRQLKLPWKGKAAPTWAKKGLTLNYAGTHVTTIPGGNPLSLPRTFSAKVQQVNKRFTLFTTSSSYNQQPEGDAPSLTGLAQMTGLWLPKEALSSKARTGRIDRDPITGVVVSWQRRSGNLIIQEEGPSWQSTLTYDGSSGVLIAIQLARQTGIATEEIELQLQQ
ncbi:MAG: hypothetical protein U0175_26560 [Caldilineaceae bacterium]